MLGLLLVFAFPCVLCVPSYTCPPAGASIAYVSDSEQCDKFYLCGQDGNLAAELLCEDGLVFDVISKQCSLPHGVDCSSRPLLQEPQAEGNCPRANGKWAVEGSCVSYTDCTSGVERAVTCQNHLVFGLARFAAAGDCRAFFTCTVYTNYKPRLGGCGVGTVFNEAKQICDEPENVPNCKNYYDQ